MQAVQTRSMSQLALHDIAGKDMACSLCKTSLPQTPNQPLPRRIVRITRIVKTVRLMRIFRFVLALRTLVYSILHTLKALLLGGLGETNPRGRAGNKSTVLHKGAERQL